MRFTIALMSLISTVALAAKQDMEIIRYDGTQKNHLLTLNAEKTHVESEDRGSWGTCTRLVESGSEYRCETSHGGGTICKEDRDCWVGDNGRECTVTPVCTTDPGVETCGYYPTYTNEYYECWNSHIVSWEVKDYDVKANIAVEFDALSTKDLMESVEIHLVGERIFARVSKTRGAHILLSQLSETSKLENGLKTIDAKLTISAIPTSKLMSPILTGVSSLKANQDWIEFKWTNGMEVSNFYKINVQIEKTGLLFGYLVDKAQIPLSALKVENGAIKIPVSQVTKRISRNGKYRVSVKVLPHLENLDVVNADIDFNKKAKVVTAKFKYKKQ